MPDKTAKFAVSGATGRLGGLVCEILAQKVPREDIRALGRNEEKLAKLAQRGFTTAVADFADPESLERAYSGVQRLLLISATGPVDARIGLHKNAFAAAQKSGVDQLLYTSRVNPSDDSLYSFAPIHAEAERDIAAMSIPATVVRNSEYIENTLPAVFEAVETGHLVMPGKKGRVAHISVDEIGEILAKILLSDGHEGRIYELNGPLAVHREEVAALIEDIARRPVRAIPNTAKEFAVIRRRQGRAEFLVRMAESLFRTIDAGEFETVYPDAEHLLGRRPVSMLDVVRTQLSRSAT
jgi:NAD(P)H dehydrogenase (quinone)